MAICFLYIPAVGLLVKSPCHHIYPKFHPLITSHWCATRYTCPKKNRHVDGLYVDCGIPRFPTPRKRHFTTWNILSCSICPQKNHSLGEIPRFSWYQMSINFPFPPGHPLGTCAPCFPEMGHRSSPFASDTASGALGVAALPQAFHGDLLTWGGQKCWKHGENMVKQL